MLVATTLGAAGLGGPVGITGRAFADGEIVLGLAEPDDTAYPEVTVALTADRAGRPVSELHPDQVRVTEAGAPGSVVAVRRAQDSGKPLALVLTLDTSGSMQGASMEQAQAAASALLQRLAPEDAAAVVAFSDDARVVQSLTTDRLSTQRAVSGLVATGNTALYDAVAESARVAAESGLGRRAVVLLSDGREFGGASRTTREESLQRVAQDGAVFYMIGVGPDIDAAYLEEIATRSGGRFFRAAGPGQVSQVYSALEDLLRAQFLVTLRSTAPAAGASRKLVVEVRTAEGQGLSERQYASRRPIAAASGPLDPPVAPAAERAPLEPTRAPTASRGSWLPAWGDLQGAALAIGAGGTLGALAMGGVGYYFGHVRRRRKSPVQLRSLRRGVDVIVESPSARGVPDFVPSNAGVDGRTPAPGDWNGEGPRAVLRQRSGGAVGPAISLGSGSTLIGTDEDCEIRPFASAGVAPHHARIVWREGHALIEHLAPGFETRVNGRSIDCAPLDTGYEIEVGRGLMLRFEAVASAERPTRRVVPGSRVA